jgi:hypothetical protein
MGIANRSHGSITIAPVIEIKTVLSVRDIAMSGAAAIRTPSAKFETKLLAHKRLKAGPMARTLVHQIKMLLHLFR